MNLHASIKTPSFFVSPERAIGGHNPCFVIAECGQNHQGDVNIAMHMIKEAAHNIKVDCVKFQKSDLNSKFNYKALNRLYSSPHSWGETYGEHKNRLEFTNEQFISLQRYAINEGILFSSSAMDKKSLEFLSQINVPFIKIGSGDTNNYPLLKLAAAKNVPLFVSTGMNDISIVENAYSIVNQLNSQLSLLYCVSAYPTPFQEIDLKVLYQYYKCFPKAVIGYSGHETGTEISVSAVAIGAKVLERHFTLDKSMKGTDHAASLEPKEFYNLMCQIRNVEKAMSGSGEKKRSDCELKCYEKLGKSIVAAKFLPKGSIITEECIDIKVAEPFGIEAHHFYTIIGKTLMHDIENDESIKFSDLI